MRAKTILMAMLLATSAHAQQAANPDSRAAIDALNSEARCYDFPGPEQGATRPVCVWYPRNSTATSLPVIYMADGMVGIHVAVAGLKSKLDAGTIAPFMVVAVNAKQAPVERAYEYVYNRSQSNFEMHEKWLMQQVIPWAERTMKASPERNKRFIGGFSNGADLALALANRHPEIFSGALLHSPLESSVTWIGKQADTQRWVVTGVLHGVPEWIKNVWKSPQDIAFVLRSKRAPVRACVKRWGRQSGTWSELSPGSITWLMGLGETALAESPIEQSQCTNS